ncbi:MAG: ABC transporter substrate-binding protein [Patescibacteria group bacterium]
MISLLTGAVIFLTTNRLVRLIGQKLPKTTRIGIVGKYGLSTLPPKISHLISYGLTEILPNGEATSSPLISGWTIKSEGKEYLFFLKPDIRWQDGSPLKPEEINYQIDGVAVGRSERGIHLMMESAFAPLPSLLDSPIFKKNTIGLGKYNIKKAKIKAGRFSSLLLVSEEKGKQERLLFRFYPNESGLITAFKLGEIDRAWEVSNIDEFASEKNVTIKTESGSSKKYVALFFNTRKDPFSSKRIRQSIAYALKKPEKKDRAIGPISPSSWAYNEKLKTYQYDVEHAKKLLESEDWKPEEDFSVKIYTLPELLEWTERAKSDLKENLQINSEVKVSSFIPNESEFDIFVGFGIIPADPDQYPIWHSTQPGNLTGINNPRVDQLLEKGRTTIDHTERKEIYYEFQRALSEEAPAIFLFYPPSYTISRD